MRNIASDNHIGTFRATSAMLMLLSGGLFGCSNVLSPPPARQLPLVEGLLIADSTSSSIRISWPANTDSGSIRVPAAEHEVGLVLAEVGGPAAALTPVIDSPGLFTAALTITSGKTYLLTGTVGTIDLSGSTTIPTTLEVVDPAADPLVLTSEPELGHRFAVDTIEWNATHAVAIVADSIRFGAGYDVSRDRRTTIIVPRWSGDSIERSAIRFWALNEDAASYGYGQPAGRSNIRGALGAIGGASVTVKPVAWQ